MKRYLIFALLSILSATSIAANRTYAEYLLAENLLKHPEIAHLVMHVTPPGELDTNNIIIASNLGAIGKLADADDLRIMETGEPEMVLAKTKDRMNVSVPFLDQQGKVIGVIGIGLRIQPTLDKNDYLKMAISIRNELQKQIPQASTLFTSK